MDSNTILPFVPLLLLELGLKVICLRDWLKRDNFNGFGKIAWLLLFLFITLLGPLAYLIYGRKDHGSDRD